MSPARLFFKGCDGLLQIILEQIISQKNNQLVIGTDEGLRQRQRLSDPSGFLLNFIADLDSPLPAVTNIVDI
ncbi:hypothetical protein D3C71_2141270 [compost metagenome]